MLFNSLTQSSPPAEKALSIAKAKDFLRVDHNDDNTLIEDLLSFATQYVEDWTKQALITQTWVVAYDRIPWMPDLTLELPKPPLQSVTSVEARDDDGNYSVFSADKYSVDTASMPGRIKFIDLPNVGTQYTANLRVTFICGYGTTSAAVPDVMKAAIRLVLAHFYERRDMTVIGQSVNTIPLHLQSVLNSVKVRTL